MDQPPPNDSAGERALYILTPIVAIGILLHFLRILTRIFPAYKLNSSDYTSIVAVISAITTYTLFATAVSYGLGRRSVYITPENTVRILQHLYGVLIVGLLTSCFARISVACLLLELASSNTWKAVLWLTISFQIACLLLILPLEAFQCHPIRSFWDPMAGGKCISPAVMWTLGYVFNGASILGDLLQAILPLCLIWKLNRSRMERCLISFLMAMGLFASAAGVMKIIYQTNFDRTSPDSFLELMPVFLWYRIEEALLVFASSAPLLKCPIGQGLQRLGLRPFRFRTMELNSFHSSQTPAPHNYHRRQEQAERRERKNDELKLETGEYSFSTASSPCDISGCSSGTGSLSHCNNNE